MADTTTSALGLTKPEEEASDNTWGLKLNNNFDTIDDELAGVTTIASTSGTVALSSTQQNAAILDVTATLIGNLTLQFDRKGIWVVVNRTSGAYTLTTEVSGQGTPPTIDQGTTALVACNGTSVYVLSQVDTGTAASEDIGTSGDAIGKLNTANTWSAGQTISTTSATGQLTIIASEDGSSAGPDLALQRISASPAANDGLAEIKFRGKDSGGNTELYATLKAKIVDPTDASEDGKLTISSIIAGTFAERWHVGAGVYAEGRTDPGAGKINVTGLSLNDADVGAIIGKQSAWIPAGAMTAQTTNGAASGSAETTTNDVMIASLDFDTATAEYAQFSFRMPKGWNESTITCTPVWTHGSTTTNFGVVWSISAQALGDSDALDTAWGTAQTSTDTGGTTNDVFIAPETSAITIAGTPAEGDMVFVRVSRAVANGSDNMAVDAKLLGVMLNYTINASTDD